MIKKYICFGLFLIILIPVSGFGFSEAEMEALGKTGEKSLSSRPWRVDLNVLLQRNLKLDVYIQDSVFNPDQEHSLANNWFWGLEFKFNYSLKNISEALKDTEMFLQTAFITPFEGYEHLLKDYSPGHFIGYALKDLDIGFTTPFYKREEFLSYLDVYVGLPLSRFSREATLWTSLGASLDFLWFIKKEADWSLALASSHGAAYHLFKNAYSDPSGGSGDTNKFLTTINLLGPVLRQSYNKILPSSTGVFGIHEFAIDTDFTQFHFLSFGGGVSWKLQKQLFFKFLILWKDKVHIYNRNNPKEGLSRKVDWFDLENTTFRLSLSYSF